MKVKAHTSASADTSFEDTWKRLGNAAADTWAKKGTGLWKTPVQRILFVEACGARAQELVRWIGRVNSWLVDQGFSDTDGVVGTSDVVLELGEIEREDEADALDEALDAREQLQWKRVDCVPTPEPEATSKKGDGVTFGAGEFHGRPWLFKGHSVIACDVGVEADAHPPLFFCKTCGASLSQRVSPGKGLAAKCFGAQHAGLKTQRSRLRRRLHPSALSPLRISGFRGVGESDREWLHERLSGSPPGVCCGPPGGGPGAVGGPAGGPACGPSWAGGGSGPGGPDSPWKYGTKVPVLDHYKVASLHGFTSPDSAVEWAKGLRRSRKVVDEFWPLEGEAGE